MTLLSLTYVHTPQYSSHPTFAYAPCGHTSRLSLLWLQASSWQNLSPVLPLYIYITHPYPSTTTVPLELYSLPSKGQVHQFIHSFTLASPSSPSTCGTTLTHQHYPQIFSSRRSRHSMAAIAPPLVSTSSSLAQASAASTRLTRSLAHAGHRTTLLESASVLGVVGAGIQVSPNATRILHR